MLIFRTAIPEATAILIRFSISPALMSMRGKTSRTSYILTINKTVKWIFWYDIPLYENRDSRTQQDECRNVLYINL